MPKFKPEWYVGEFDAHTNKVIFSAVQEHTLWYALLDSQPLAGKPLAEPVLRVPYELIQWLERNREECNLSFTALWRCLPNVPLARYRLVGYKKQNYKTKPPLAAP